MKRSYGTLASGEEASLYTITGGALTAQISDLGACIVSLLVPDSKGNTADVILAFDNAKDQASTGTYFGAVVGRNANRVGNAEFVLNGKHYQLDANDKGRHCLHSGFNPFRARLWKVVRHTENSICLSLHSPHGDQGFPGNADIRVTYTLEAPGTLAITYDAICDQDTVFNLTNHAYFNLAGHDHPEKAMSQTLSMPARHFTVADAQSIPTGELRSVEGSPMDFRTPKAIGRDIGEDYDALKLQGGYDHNFEVFTNPCAILRDPESGRTMSVLTDCCGVQFYSGNYLEGEVGKGGVVYTRRGGICLETQFYPDAIHNPQWKQPVTAANTPYHSETRYCFTNKE